MDAAAWAVTLLGLAATAWVVGQCEEEGGGVPDAGQTRSHSFGGVP